MLDGYLMLGLIGVVVLVRVWVGRQRRRSRDPRSFVTTTTVDGAPATVVRGQITLVPATVAILAVGAYYGWLAWRYVDGPGLLVFVLLDAWLLGAVVLLVTGRVQHRDTVITRDGITQSDAGMVQHVRWADVRAFDSKDGALNLHSGSVDRRRTAPVLFVGRQRDRVVPHAMRLQHTGFHPGIRLVPALLDWHYDPRLRSEIGTEAAVERLVGDRR